MSASSNSQPPTTGLTRQHAKSLAQSPVGKFYEIDPFSPSPRMEIELLFLFTFDRVIFLPGKPRLSIATPPPCSLTASLFCAAWVVSLPASLPVTKSMASITNQTADARVIAAAAAAQCGGGSTILGISIGSQADADDLRLACPTVTGDITIATSVASAINLDGLVVLTGQISSSGSDITALSSSTLTGAAKFDLANQTGLQNISFPQLALVQSDFNLDTLPALERVSVPNLATVGSFRIVNAPVLASLQVNLQAIATELNPDYPTTYEDTIEISGVGLASLSGLDVSDAQYSTYYLRVHDNPQLKQFRWTAPGFGPFHAQIHGAGNLDLVVLPPARKFDQVGLQLSAEDDTSLNVSGLHSFTYVSEDTLYFQAAYFDNNTMATLNLSNMPVVTNISVTNNPNLVSLTLPDSDSENDFTSIYTGRTFNINISNNTKLSSDNITQSSGHWPWGIVQASSMVFQNCLFHTDFLWVSLLPVLCLIAKQTA